MNGEVQLIVRTEKLPENATATDSLISPIVSGDSFCIGPSGQSATYTIGSKIEIVDQNVSPEVVVFTRYITGYDDATGEISVNEPFTSNVPDAGHSIYTYTLTITESYLDLYENESISQNWKFQDLSNFTAQGAFSREFRIPFSQNNKEAIGALFDNNVEQGAQNYFFYKLPAEIRVDTLPIATGYLRVRKVYKQMGKVNDVEVAFYAETPDLVRTIGEKKLSDIAALADLNEVLNYANVTTQTADRIWSLCDRAQKWSNGGESGSRPIRDVNNPIYPADLTPSVSWWFLLRNIVNEAGFDLVASSLENIIEDYYMPFCNTPQLTAIEQTNDYFFRVYNASVITASCSPTSGDIPIDDLTEVFDNNNDFTPLTGTYTAPVSGSFSFRGRCRFSAYSYGGGAVRAQATLYIAVNGGFYTNAAQTPYFTSGNSLVFNQTIQLNAGDTVTFVYYARCFLSIGSNFILGGSCGISLNIGDGSIDGLNTFIELYNVEATGGQTINYALNAPDMRQIDFVNDVIKMHNCAIVPSRIVPNRIAIIPQNNYLGTGDTIDWTPKLDISKDIMVSSTVDIQKAKFQFTYTAGEDAYSKLYVDANRVYGDYQAEGYTINPSTAPSDFAIGEQKIQLITRSTPAALIPNTGTPIPCFYNEELEFVAPGPRALFYANDEEINLYNDGTSSATPTTLVPVLNHYSNTYPNVNDLDLNWAPEVPPHDITVIGNPYSNLFNTYWRNYMNDLYSPEGRIMEAFFALDLKDILTFSFADKIWIQDAYWRILEISDYKIGYNESTKVKLIKFLDQIQDCASTPVGSTANGEVTFENGEGDPVEATEDCCSRYGYFWDEINGVCWAFNNGGQFRNSLVQNNNTSQNTLLNVADNSVANGVKISVEQGNLNMLAVGQDLSLTKFVNGSNLLGKNVLTNLPGIHVGGGYRDGIPSSTYYGWAQFGLFVLQKKFTVGTSGDVFDLDIEGVLGQYIELSDDTVWSCILNLTIRDEAGVSETSLHHFTLDKIGGNANASAITTLNTIGAIGANVFALGIDTTTNTAEHRINVTVTGGTYPENFIVSATLQYQQSKTS